jgi:adenosylhomocysteine nucleosidase
MKKIAVLFALPIESSEFVRRLENRSRAHRNGITIVQGTLNDRSIEVMHTGVGKKICEERLEKILKDQRFDLLISSGFAGSLDDELRLNDVLIARNFSTVDSQQALASVANVSIRVVKMLTAPAPVDYRAEREKIARESGASAVDMETESIARVCAAHEIPLLSLRVVTDTPSQPLPAPPIVLFNIQLQRTDMAALSKFFLRHPNRLAGLIAFTGRIRRARTILTNAIVEVVRNI